MRQAILIMVKVRATRFLYPFRSGRAPGGVFFLKARAMNDKKTYSEKLKDPRWQKKRLEILKRDNWACYTCESKKKTLHVHHAYYDKDLEPWEYESDSLITLCHECHEKEKSVNKEEDVIQVLREFGFISKDLSRLEDLIWWLCTKLGKQKFIYMLSDININIEKNDGNRKIGIQKSR